MIVGGLVVDRTPGERPPLVQSIDRNVAVESGRLSDTKNSQAVTIKEVAASCMATPRQGQGTNQTNAEAIPNDRATAPMRGEPSGHEA